MNFNYSISEFESLSLNKKYQTLIDHGFYISTHFKCGMGIYLFSYHNYFVEIWKSLKNDKPDWIRIVKNEILDSYFTEIDLKDLLPIA